METTDMGTGMETGTTVEIAMPRALVELLHMVVSTVEAGQPLCSNSTRGDEVHSEIMIIRDSEAGAEAADYLYIHCKVNF